MLEVEAALRLNPRLTHAIGLLISAAKATTGNDCVALFKRFYEQVGASVNVRMDLARCLLPRWGGSYQALEALAEEAEEHADENPGLSALGGMVSWDRGTAADAGGRKALELYTDALRHGPHPPFLLARSRNHFDRGRHNDALADIEQALRQSPHDTEALALVGEDAELLYWRGRAGIEADNHSFALPNLLRAVQLDPRHFDAIESLDYVLTSQGQFQLVVQHWTAYLGLEPTNAKALLARAKAHIGRGDVKPGAADAVAACTAGLQEACLLALTVRQ